MKKLIACTFNMTSSCVELKFSDSSMIAINYTAMENKILTMCIRGHRLTI